jgi:Tol biopolymer transport system component
VTTGVECPSLSPDGRLIAFKKRVSDDPVSWRLWVLDVATGRQHATAETRPIDDQAGWLDDHTVTYGLPATGAAVQRGGADPSAIQAGSSVDTATWAVPADGTGSPRMILDHAWSTQLSSGPGRSPAGAP